MKPVLWYYRGAIIPCWERGYRLYPVVLHPNGPPPIPWKFLTDDEMQEKAWREMAEMRQRIIEQHARVIEASFWNPPVTR